MMRSRDCPSESANAVERDLFQAGSASARFPKFAPGVHCSRIANF
jgi:hypothetical protein